MHENISSMSAQSMLNLGLSKKGFKMGHLNIQGIQNKIDQLDLLLNSSKNDIDILGLSESKLNSSHMNSFFKINNYQTFRKDRLISTDRPQHGGGLIVYVKDGIKCERRTDLECERIECVWLEIFPKTRTVRKSDYTPALALSKHMAGIFDKKCREKEKYREEQIGECPFSIPCHRLSL